MQKWAWPMFNNMRKEISRPFDILSRPVTVTPRHSDYVNKCGFYSTVTVNSHTQPTITGTFLRIRTIKCMRTWQLLCKIDGDCSDKGCHLYQPLDRFILREVLARKRVKFTLRVMTYFLSYNLFWNWIGAVRFEVVSHEVCSDRGLGIWYLFLFVFTNLVVVIAEYLNSHHLQYQWIGKLNKTLKSNALHTKSKWKKMRRRQNWWQKMRRKQDFWTESWWELCPVDVVCKSLFTKHRTEWSFFNSSKNELIY